MNELELLNAVTMLSVSILIGSAGIGSAIGVGGVGAKLIESIARQPTQASELQNRAGMLDVLPILSVAIGLLLLFANPLS